MRQVRVVVRLVFILLTLTGALPIMAQGKPTVDEYNVPGEVDDCVKKMPGVSIDGGINPFYLSGDFDGDGKLDIAVQVVRAKARGILICLSTQKAPLLVGAGSSTIWPAKEEWRFDAWSIITKESKAVSRPTGAKHDAILLDIKETANGLLYWDGTALRWQQLGD
jgi:hypothetical protein